MLRLFGSRRRTSGRSARSTRFLDLLDEAPESGQLRPALDALVLSFQLKLLWLAGYLPHLTSCVECGSTPSSSATRPRAGGAVCRVHAQGALRLSPEGLSAIERAALDAARRCGRRAAADRARRDALAVITSSYEEHGGFRLRTLSA